jgi:predicted nucleic-acid-binding Zn-ribbon protein
MPKYYGFGDTDIRYFELYKRLYFRTSLLEEECQHIHTLRVLLGDVYLSEQLPDLSTDRSIQEQQIITHIKNMKEQTLKYLRNKRDSLVNITDEQRLQIIHLQNDEKYGLEPGTGISCNDCSKVSLRKIIKYNCVNCGKESRRNDNQRQKYCIKCRKRTFRQGDIIDNTKVTFKFNKRQDFVFHAIYTKYNDFIFDSPIEYGVSTYRPDCQLELKNYFIIVEIDEHEHKLYVNEHDRMKAIGKDIIFKHVVFIRFNIDNYIINNIEYPSPWIKTSISMPPYYKLNDKCIDDWNDRLKKLLETIEYFIQNDPDESIIVNLYYSDNHHFIYEPCVTKNNYPNTVFTGVDSDIDYDSCDE